MAFAQHEVALPVAAKSTLARLRLLEQIPAILWTTDRDLRFASSTGGGLRQLGLEPGQVVGLSLQEYLGTEDPADVAITMHLRALRGESVTYDNEIAGRAFHCRLEPLADDSGRIAGVIGIALDVTGRRRAERALHSIVAGTSSTVGEEFFHSLVRHLAQALTARSAIVCEVVSASAGRVETLAVWRNEAGAENFACVLADTPCAELLSGAPCFHQRGVGELFPAGHPLRELVVDSLRGAPLRASDGSVIGLLVVMDLRGMAADPSAERLLEVFASRAGAELQRLRAERALARAAEERARLEEQMRHAQKLESLGVLAGGIAHDFNNLLVGMLGNAGLALADLPEGLPGRRYVEEIASSARRAAELANQMLAYSGKGRFVVRTVDLNELVADMVHLLEASVSKKAGLRVALAPRAPCVEADATQLRQVVMNLITNASDALGETSGTISVTTGEVDVSRARLAGSYIDEGLPAGRYVFLRVEDTGCGMDEATRRRIFDPFFTTKFTGRGLGLAAVMGIVRGHRGALELESEVGRGTAFTVLLPRSGARPAPVEVAEAAPAWLSNGVVLVVDDEPTVRHVAERTLRARGFEVLTAEDGRQAIEVFRANVERVLAVLLDLTMPVLGGLEALAELRRIRPDVPVLLSSGYAVHDAVVGLGEQDLAGFVQKPYTPTELVSALRAAVEARSRGSRALPDDGAAHDPS